ncbi:putative glycoside hydrolase [Ammoniphilus oxalaticus]|uniref:putative glycoside hydrolase n=1 Tax=Ammoniphilus oxalaticus TaxID=66863 RepID=UPI0014731732|nr:putative glycoside hydrolase [Ammoniphilus oxalaticus]
MRKNWSILFASALLGFTVSGCSQQTTVEPVSPDMTREQFSWQAFTDPNGLTQAKGAHASELPDEETAEKADIPSFTYPDAVRGIYVTAHSAGGAKLDELIALVDETELNAMVIDIKDDYGWITYSLEGEWAPFSKNYIADPKALLEKLSEHQIYPIARIVVFKDSVLAAEKPETSFQQAGQVWKNRRGEAFVNPFLKSVWEHNIEIAKLAAELGFREIQFDYVRFPEGFETRDQTLTYSMGAYSKEELEPRLMQEWEKELVLWEQEQEREMRATNTKPIHNEGAPVGSSPRSIPAFKMIPSGPPQKIEQRDAITNSPSDERATETTAASNNEPFPSTPPPPEPVYDAVKARVSAVTDFVRYAREQLAPYGVDVSVDIFGYAATLPEAPGIGQNFKEISDQVDVISSMIYPSHWGPGYFNIAKPDLEPYRLTREYMKVEKEKLAELENPPISRPWLQDFTASWLGKGNYLSYGPREVEQQVQALLDEGVEEFLLWNAVNNYTRGVNYAPIKEEADP